MGRLADIFSSILSAAFALMVVLGVVTSPREVFSSEPLGVQECPANPVASCSGVIGCIEGAECYYSPDLQCYCYDGVDDGGECLCIT